jgi:alpha-galactosidase
MKRIAAFSKVSSCLIIAVMIILSSCTGRKSATAIATVDPIPPLDKSLAIKPPMGWNSWDCLGWGATEAEVRANAEYMAKNLKGLGYEYIVIDMLWYGDEIASDFEAFVHETVPVKPNYYLDEYGRFLPDPVRYPSSKDGKGFKPLADYIHSLGLKFGVHILRGIPWQAADKNITIKGTSIRAASIAQPDKGCEWYDGIYGIDMTKPGAQEYYNSQFELFAEWGVDFVKADDMEELDLVAVSRASRTCGRKIVLSIVGNSIPMNIQKENAHMARLGADFWDVWEMLKRGFPLAARAVKNSEPGFWPDLDMLPIGKLGLKISYKGPDPRISNFNKEELHSLLTLWYISRQPLMIGGYLPETDKYTLELLKNEEALAVDRNSINNRQIKFKNAIIIWTADIQGSEDKYLAFFNQWESREPVNIKVNWSQLGLAGTEYKVRDLWAKKDIGAFKGEFSAPVSAHGAGLYKISKQGS